MAESTTASGSHVKRHGLSKSKLLSFLQCPKRLYLEVHRPELKEILAETEQRFSEGHRVGAVARALVPGGILIGHDDELGAALAQTRAALASEPERPLYEATFEHDGVLVRVDLLLPAGRGHRLIEVKAATSVKDPYLPDCAIQSWVVEGAGYPLERVELAHIDNRFVYPGGGNYRGLLHNEDLTTRIAPLKTKIPQWVDEGRRVLAGAEPDIGIGKQCEDPYACPFLGHCSPPQPEYPVTLLPYDKHKRIAKGLQADGIHDVREIPAGRLENENHERIRRVTAAGRAELNPAARAALARHAYPRYYLDFETASFAVPVWASTRPYQRLPFQWSCHIETAAGELRHDEYLGLGPEPPMRGFAERLLAAVNSQGPGPIFAYNQGFEIGCVRELAAMFPDLAKDLDLIPGRMVDLHPIAKEHYYHPDMKGSWSLKDVLPTVAPELDYGNLDHVQDGGGAGIAYQEILDPATEHGRRADLVQALRRYCERDTFALVRLARFLADGPTS